MHSQARPIPATTSRQIPFGSNGISNQCASLQQALVRKAQLALPTATAKPLSRGACLPGELANQSGDASSCTRMPVGQCMLVGHELLQDEHELIHVRGTPVSRVAGMAEGRLLLRCWCRSALPLAAGPLPIVAISAWPCRQIKSRKYREGRTSIEVRARCRPRLASLRAAKTLACKADRGWTGCDRQIYTAQAPRESCTPGGGSPRCCVAASRRPCRLGGRSAAAIPHSRMHKAIVEMTTTTIARVCVS